MTVLEQAKQLIDTMPKKSTWKDLAYEFYVRQKIEAALKDLKAGRSIPHEEVKRRILSKFK